MGGNLCDRNVLQSSGIDVPMSRLLDGFTPPGFRRELREVRHWLIHNSLHSSVEVGVIKQLSVSKNVETCLQLKTQLARGW